MSTVPTKIGMKTFEVDCKHFIEKNSFQPIKNLGKIFNP